MSGEFAAAHRQALQLLAEEENARTLTVASTIQDMKASVFFRQNWDELLLATPNCLELLGIINAAGSTRLARATPLRASDDGGFAYIVNYGNLQSGLSQLTSQAAKSFVSARSNIQHIHAMSRSAKEELEGMVSTLSIPRTHMTPVLEHMSSLKRNADDCYDAACDMQETITNWSNMCMELHGACSGRSAKTAPEAVKTLTVLELARVTKDTCVEQETKAKDRLTEMDKQVAEARDLYKNALNAMPGGIGLVGQRVLRGLGESVSSCLQIGTAAAAASVSPVEGAIAGTCALKAEVDRYAPALNRDSGAGAKVKQPADKSTPPKETDTKTASRAAASARRSALLSKLTTAFACHPTADASKNYGTYDLNGRYMADDRALSITPAIRALIEETKQIVVGYAEGINWDAVLKPTGPARGTISELAQVSYTLNRLLEDFRPAEGGLVSQLAVAIMTEAIAVAGDLEAEAVKGAGLSNWAEPDRTSDFFMDLESRIARCSSAALALDAASKATPGGLRLGSTSLHSPKPILEGEIAGTKYKATAVEYTVKSANTKMLMTHEARKATLVALLKQREQLLQVLNNLRKARQEVESITIEKMTLDMIRKTLLQCIRCAVEFKNRVSGMVVFFSSLKTLVDMCIKSHLLPFHKELEIYARQNSDNAPSYEMYYRDVIFKYAVTIGAKLAMAKDVSRMYLEVDQHCIEEGLHFVDKLDTSNTGRWMDDEDYREATRKRLSGFCRESENRVEAVVKTNRQEIISGLEKRISDIAMSVGKFPTNLWFDKGALETVQIGTGIAQSLTEAEVAARVSPINILVAGQEREEGEIVG
ncbi:hypothetical protein F5Y17DRAFT_179388 [Xylariaceae sp. FL0594]|nr:hypothetical protein F5Y17DRAFT_179388 [Xylariaceae sp. FL0594]